MSFKVTALDVRGHPLNIILVKTEKVIIDLNLAFYANMRKNIDTFYVLRGVKRNFSVIHSLTSHSARFV